MRLRTLAASLAALALVAVGAASPAAASPGEGSDLSLHYTFVRVDYPDANIPGDLATNAQVRVAAQTSTDFWNRISGAPHLDYDVVPGVLQIPGEANPCPLCSDMRVQIEEELGHVVGPLVIFFRQGYPTPHYTGQAMVGEDIVNMFGTFGDDDVSPGWDRVAHEIGHNLGFNHDSQQPSRWTTADFIHSDSYWNPYSVMGGGKQAPAAWQQAKRGWLTAYGFRLGTTRSLWDLQTSVWSQPRLLHFTAGPHTYDLEYRPQAVDGSPAGAVLYLDGQAVETASGVYSLPVGTTYWLGDSGEGLRVSGPSVSGNLRYVRIALVRK